MAQTKFLEYFKGFETVANTFYKSLIDGKKEGQPYYYKQFFTEEYSVDGKWRSVSGASTRTTADMVSLDSSLPLKKRDSIKKAEDSIPKMGLKMTLNENQMKQIQLLELTRNFTQVEDILYKDSFRVQQGIEEMKEYLALQAVSTGRILVGEDEKAGIGIRVDFGVPTANRFGVISNAWSNAAADPIADLERVAKAARDNNGDTIRVFRMSKATSVQMLNNANVKSYYGAYLQVSSGQNFLAPRLEQLNQALSSDKGFVIEVIDRTVKFEKNGAKEVKECWADGMVVGSVDSSFGKIVYTDLAEERFPDEDVVYTKVGTHILLSRWHENDPIREFTSAQSSVLPVLDDVDSLYYLDVNDAPTVTYAQTEGDSDIDLDANRTIGRTELIAALKAVGANAKASNKDETLVRMYNDLSDADQATVDAAIAGDIVDNS